MSSAPLYILGVDLGQAQDYTALTVLERTAVDTGRTKESRRRVSTIIGGDYAPGWSRGQRPADTVITKITENHYAARHLERLPIGTPYPAQVLRIKELHNHLKAETGTAPQLVVDQTGVGRPVVDMLRAAALSPVSVSITGGDSVTREGNVYRVPKRDLVSAVQVLLQAKRLKIASSLKEAATLTAELLAFKVSISLKGHDSYGNDVGPWRENSHDDLVLAVALACWYGEQHRPVSVPKRRSTVTWKAEW
jgi:hypothetical protein